jgi:uncharacterized protein (DUF885 family)
MRSQDDTSAVRCAMKHPNGLAGRLVSALTWSLGLLVSPVVQAAEPFESTAASATSDYTTDGRMPLGTIMGRFDDLSTAHGWIAETIYDYPGTRGIAIKSWRTPHRGEALWILSGIHGEEPAGPNAIAANLASLTQLADAGIPIVVIPLANPNAYRHNWRYPNTPERDWKKGGGYSVGDAEHLLPDLDAGDRPRAAKAPGPETSALTQHVLRLAEFYPPRLVLDLHEDELSQEGGYIYSQGRQADGNPAGAEIIRLLQATGIPLRQSGKTRFGETIVQGVISRDDQGGPIRDGSIDELLAATEVFVDGRKVRGPSAHTVIVVETPAFEGSKFALRVAAQGAVLQHAADLWRAVDPPAAGTASTPPSRSAVEAIADDYLATLARMQPEFGTAEDLPGTDHGTLTDNTEPAIARWRAYEDQVMAQLRAVPAGSLRSESDRVLYGVLRDELGRSAGARVCRLELWGVASYVNGWQASLTDLARVQPVGSDALRAAALRRASAIPRFIDNEIVLLRQGLHEGYSSPKVIVREVIRQLDELLATKPEHSPFAAPTERDSDPRFSAAYQAVVRDEINPAVRRYRDFLSKTYLPAARHELGVSANPNGRACYDAVVRQFSTVSMPADQVYEAGWQQIRALDEQMRPIAVRLTGTDDLARAMHMVNTESRFAFRTEADVIAYAQAAQDRASAAMPRVFGLYTTLPVQIQPYPEFRARAGAPGQYQAPPEDGSRPPIHLLNTWDPTHKSRASIESTTFHETWPGHHQQIMVARDARAQHRLVRALFNSGFGEGWALYAERVADEMGLYSGDLDRFGFLSSAKFRSARMVIDSGIHTRGMSYEDAIKLLTEQSTLSPAQVRGEVNRYISWPGQAPSYMIGNLEILRLRDAAKAKFGPQFDLRAFHDQVLGRGSVTLPLLRELVEEWIASSRATPMAAAGAQ